MDRPAEYGAFSGSYSPGAKRGFPRLRGGENDRRYAAERRHMFRDFQEDKCVGKEIERNGNRDFTI